MLLLRRLIELTQSYADDWSTPVIVSLYRSHVDSGYQWLIWNHAETGYFDRLFLETMMDVIQNGM